MAEFVESDQNASLKGPHAEGAFRLEFGLIALCGEV